MEKEVVKKRSENDSRETHSLIMGIVLMLTLLFFLAYKTKFLNLNINITDEIFLWTFAGLIVISAIFHFISVLD